MNDSQSFKDHFLIAMPSLVDPNFFHSVTYLCDHSKDGAMGLVINHAMGISVAELLDHMGIMNTNEQMNHHPVLAGGPLQTDRGFVLHRPWGTWESSMQVSEELCITSSRDILVAIANNQGPEQMLFALGYAGWDAGQLEEELADNAWLSCEANTDLLFGVPAPDRWSSAAAILGVDLKHLSTEIGHA